LESTRLGTPVIFSVVMTILVSARLYWHYWYWCQVIFQTLVSLFKKRGYQTRLWWFYIMVNFCCIVFSSWGCRKWL